MPLIVATLQSELIGILEKPNGNPAPVTVGMDIAKAYLNFCSAGMNVGGFPFTAMPGSTALGSELGNILGKTNASGQLTAMDMAKAFDQCLQTFISTNQTTIVTAPGLPVLNSELVQVFSSVNSTATLFCQSFASALNNYTATAIVSGLIPGSPPVPFMGPIN